MSAEANTPPPILAEQIPAPEQTLRRLFLTLFLRGRAARGIKRQTAPKSLGQKLALTLVFYALFGLMATFFLGQPIFALAVYLHAMTFVFLGMFVASSAGEMLFNKEEADILMHRPITPKALLWAKVRVLMEVSLWIAGAFNLVGLFVGFHAAGGWLFPLVHVVSVGLEALFCTGCVVLAYQLCLRWFGRERLDGLMTTVQVMVSILAVLSGQVLPRMIMQMNHVLNVSESSWWIHILPPAWFAGLDDALSGSNLAGSWALAATGVLATMVVVWAAFGRLAQSYHQGLQMMNETVSRPVKRDGRGRWLSWLVEMPPLSWWQRKPVERAAFLLTAAYLTRDRDVKLRVYPGLAPVLIIPFVFLFQNRGGPGGPTFGVAFSGMYLGLVPMMGMQFLQYSQQWQAADVFRVAPLPGPGALCHGARRAILCLLLIPMILLVMSVIWLMRNDWTQLWLLLPGLLASPLFALAANIRGTAIPLSMPVDASKSARRGLNMIVFMLVVFGVAGLADWAWNSGRFYWFISAETLILMALYPWLRWRVSRATWSSMDGESSHCGLAGKPEI